MGGNREPGIKGIGWTGAAMEKTKPHRIFSSVDVDGNWEKYSTLRKYVWKGKATVSPLNGKKVRSLVAIDQEGYYRAAIRNCGESIHEPPIFSLRHYPGGMGDVIYCGMPYSNRADAIKTANELCSIVLQHHLDKAQNIKKAEQSYRKMDMAGSTTEEHRVKQKAPRMRR